MPSELGVYYLTKLTSHLKKSQCKKRLSTSNSKVIYLVTTSVRSRSAASEPQNVEIWTAGKVIANEEFIPFPIIFEYKKKNCEINTAVILSFTSTLVKEFEEIINLSHRLINTFKLLYEVGPVTN